MMVRKFDPKNVSRALSKALRHEPNYLLLPDITDGGWAPVEAVLDGLEHQGWGKLTVDDVDAAISWGPKRRMEFSADRTKIRAMQGHSIDVLMNFVPVAPPAVLYHGTAEHVVADIQEEGLMRMGRQYVHMSSDRKTAIDVGKRHGKPALFAVLARVMHDDGLPFYQANNGVWLTDHVPAVYLELMP